MIILEAEDLLGDIFIVVDVREMLLLIMMNNRKEDSMETVTILVPQSNNTWPYFTCLNCGMSNIEKGFQQCPNCGAQLIWGIRKVGSLEELLKGTNLKGG